MQTKIVITDAMMPIGNDGNNESVNASISTCYENASESLLSLTYAVLAKKWAASHQAVPIRSFQ